MTVSVFFRFHVFRHRERRTDYRVAILVKRRRWVRSVVRRMARAGLHRDTICRLTRISRARFQDLRFEL